MAENGAKIEAFIAKQLQTISVEDEAITEYFARLVEEESMEEPEKREAITELLADVTEASTAEIIDIVFEHWNQLRNAELKKAEEEKEKAIAAAKEKERASLMAEFESASANRDAPLSMSSRHVVKNMTKEERKKRDALLAQYGYDLDEMVESANGEMEIVYKDRSAKSNDKSISTSDPLMMANTNADIVKQKEAARRAEMKKASENEKERNKAALEKQRLAAEKEKRRTQKNEKRRM
ncbi:hypothetical protein FBU30_007326 [Linnemannia zychae]|nr:hypothetical protein FBU30_007326 [Linnemannia zychae]